MTKEEKRMLWREEKRRARARLSPETRFQRSKYDRDVRKEKYKNAVSCKV